MPIRMRGKEEGLRQVSTEIEQDFRKILIAFDQAVVSGTPVDTGRARANWFMDFGAVRARTTGTLTAPDTSRAGRWNLADGNIYFHNSVEYIIYLDQGSSAQASQGILDPANAAIRGLL